ncbi:hypothetical protein EBU99_08455 [bacterium]|nr:hypothetical protein [bacterium]
MSLKKSLLSAASLGFASGSMMAHAANESAAPALAHADGTGVICFGINTCKGTGNCAVTKEQIKVANQVFKNKFKNAKPHECAGMNGCGAKDGNLEFIKKATTLDCFSSGGFVFEKKTDTKTKKETLKIIKA